MSQLHFNPQSSLGAGPEDTQEEQGGGGRQKTAKNVKGGDSPLGKSRGILNLPSHKQGGMELFRFESQGTSLRMG